MLNWDPHLAWDHSANCYKKDNSNTISASNLTVMKPENALFNVIWCWASIPGVYQPQDLSSVLD